MLSRDRECGGALRHSRGIIATPTRCETPLVRLARSSPCPDHQLIVDRPRRRHHLRHPALPLPRALVAAHGHLAGVGNDPRYTPSTTFETFPFPEGLTPDIPAADYAADPRAQAIAAAAADLNAKREAWLNPPDLVVREPEVVPGYPDRILPKDDEAAEVLKKRTLTNLYNQRPAWLDHAHARLDAAVAEAYGWGDDWRAGRLATTRSSPASSPSTRRAPGPDLPPDRVAIAKFAAGVRAAVKAAASLRSGIFLNPYTWILNHLRGRAHAHTD